MNIVETHMTVAEYCEAMGRGDIVVNRQYQRSSKVWPPIARSFLIETILLGFPMPKLSLYQITDLRSRRTIKEIVDGQQRSTIIRGFYDDKLRLSRTLDTEEAAGKTFSDLDDHFKQKFLQYPLSTDLFVAATPEEIREVFRRINSYTVPLNPEEQRHAVYQGEFKWFVHRLSKQFDGALLRMRLFTERQLVRMADAKLITEISHALLYGIRTTNKKMLNALYREKNDTFIEAQELEERITGAFDQIIDWPEIHGGPLMKPYQAYSLVLAITHLMDPVGHFRGIYESSGQRRIDREVAVLNLAELGEAIEYPEEYPELEEFVEASSSRTNVAEQRERRFQAFFRALDTH